MGSLPTGSDSSWAPSGEKSPGCLHRNPPLSIEGHRTEVQGTWLCRADGQTSKCAPALASILIVPDEMMAVGLTKGQRLPKLPVSSQTAPRDVVFPVSSRRGRVPPSPSPGFLEVLRCQPMCSALINQTAQAPAPMVIENKLNQAGNV